MERLLKTTELSIFKNHELSRDVTKESALRKLLKSMFKYGFLPAHPLHVIEKNNEKIVKDGNRRLEAAKILQA